MTTPTGRTRRSARRSTGSTPANFPKNLSPGEINQWNQLYQLYALLGFQVMDRDPASPAPALTECKPGWLGLTPLALNPTFTNVADIDKLAQGTEGVEWTHWGDTVNIYGTGPDGFARVPWDNVGVQYGLEALRSGVISPAEFLNLNAQVGSWKDTADMVPEGFPFAGPLTAENFDPWSSRNMALSPDGGATPAPRRAGDPDAMAAAYTSGMEFVGDIDIPVIDWRHYLEEELDMHNSQQSFVEPPADARRRRRRLQPGDLVHRRPAGRGVRPDADGVRRDGRVDGQHRRPPGAQRGPTTGRPARSTRASTRPGR